jgi:cytochrome P450 family 12
VVLFHWNGTSALEQKSLKKFEEIPTLSNIELLKRYMPGGKFHQKNMLDVQKMLRKELGTIHRMPGVFGQAPTVMTFDADDIEQVHRNEGAYPYRRGRKTLKYYREKIRPDFFDVCGLIVEWVEMKKSLKSWQINLWI